MSKTSKKVATKKVVKKAVKKVVGNKVNATKVTLTLKQAQAIETLLAKTGKTYKVLSNKIAAFNV